MQLEKHIHVLRIPYSVTTPEGVYLERFVNVSLIYGANGVCLIDTGVASAAQEIFRYLRQTERRLEDLSLIIQTHAHPDHIGSTRTIKGETRCKVAIHPEERSWLENVHLQAKERPVPDFDALVAGSVAVDRLLEDGEVFDLGCGLKLKIMHTPGHSRGSISILLLGYMALFSGDAIPVPGEMPVYEDVLASAASIRKLMAIEDLRLLIPSRDGAQRKAAAYQSMRAGLEYLQKVHTVVLGVAGKRRSPKPMDLCGAVLQELGIPPVMANPLVARSIAAHLAVRRQSTII